MINRRFGLCAAPILLFLVDISLTLWGQPADYWAGNYAVAKEGSPEVRRVMQIHPALLFAMIAVWMCHRVLECSISSIPQGLWVSVDLRIDDCGKLTCDSAFVLDSDDNRHNTSVYYVSNKWRV